MSGVELFGALVLVILVSLLFAHVTAPDGRRK